jgi:hypothetical protein
MRRAMSRLKGTARLRGIPPELCTPLVVMAHVNINLSATPDPSVFECYRAVRPRGRFETERRVSARNSLLCASGRGGVNVVRAMRSPRLLGPDIA